ncbi:MAG: hypothetical protein BWY02_02064 [bacterium ADurb.Bin157]|nr:MAG: hypothetical protein BWY02_02064 [bacterium ADurb.Bin157]
MENFEDEKFKEYWQKTEVIREYQQILYTFGDMRLPYVFVAEHHSYSDRTVVRRGVLYIQKPSILLPGHHNGPEFKEGFEHLHNLPQDAAFIMRSMGLPYSAINNKQTAHEELEYGRLQAVIDKLNNRLAQHDDTGTGVIKGIINGADISLMRYSIGLMIKSAPENLKQFFDHMRRQRGEPIRLDEKITDEDIERLFG